MSEVKIVKKEQVKKKLPTRSELQSDLNDLKRRFNSFVQAWQDKIDKWPVNPDVIK